jgi:hypothetical protein
VQRVATLEILIYSKALSQHIAPEQQRFLTDQSLTHKVKCSVRSIERSLAFIVYVIA